MFIWYNESVTKNGFRGVSIMLEGFLEMESLVSRVHQNLEIEGHEEYYKLEYGTERFLHTPEPGARKAESIESEKSFLRKLWIF